MSSMRNAVQRRNHKERAQPLERDKWGILEKHKDYALRAKDYNEKKKRLKILQQKATERNPDEFYFAMMSNKTHNDGQKVADRGNKSLSIDSVKLLKTQDAGYLRVMAQKTRRAREKMEEELSLNLEKDMNRVVLSKDKHALGDPQHIAFVGSREEQKKSHLGQTYEDGIVALHGRSPTSRQKGGKEIEDERGICEKGSRTPTGTKAQKLKVDGVLKRRQKRNEESRKIKLAILKNRETDLIAAERELELQRAKISSNVGGVTKAGLKWKVRERRR